MSFLLGSHGDGVQGSHQNLIEVTEGKPLLSEKMNLLFDNFEAVLNGGITKRQIAWNTDDSTLYSIRNKNWCKSRHIVKPTFFGAPAPRVEMVSSDVHYRTSFEERDVFMINNSVTTNYVPIPGLAITVHVDEEEVNTDVPGILSASFFCKEREAIHSAGNSGLTDGSPNSSFQKRTFVENDESKAAVFSAFVIRGDQVNAVEIPGTQRFVHTNFDGLAFKNHTIITPVILRRGINHIYIAVRPFRDQNVELETDFRTAFFQNILIEQRNLHFELLYR